MMTERKMLNISTKHRAGPGPTEPPSPMSHAGILARHAAYRLNVEAQQQRAEPASPPPAVGREDKRLTLSEAASPRSSRKQKSVDGESGGKKSAGSRKFSFGKFGLFGSSSSSSSLVPSSSSRRSRTEESQQAAATPEQHPAQQAAAAALQQQQQQREHPQQSSEAPPSPPSLANCYISSYQVSPSRPLAYRDALLPPRSDPNDKRIALVLDLDETLVRSSFDMTFEFDFEAPFALNGCWCTARVRKRPFVDAFLQRISKHFELIVMTAGVEPYASLVLDILDANRVLDHRFYRDSCTKTDAGLLVKDLSRMNRPMDQIVIVDNSPNAYLWHPHNAIDIKDFIGDQRDTELCTLADFLDIIQDAADVRPHLQHWKRGKSYADRYDKTKRG